MLKQFKWTYIIGGVTGLCLIYLFQDYLNFYDLIRQGRLEKLDYSSSFIAVDPLGFIVNKSLRYILNDLFAISLIYGLFTEKKYVKFAMWVLLFGLLFLLPLYIYLYLSKPEGFSSMLSHLHRLLINPVLMMLLIPPFFYQKYYARQEKKE